MQECPEFAKNFFLEYSGLSILASGLFSKNQEASYKTIEIILVLSRNKTSLDYLDKSIFFHNSIFHRYFRNVN